jgi:hypothetical protein
MAQPKSETGVQTQIEDPEDGLTVQDASDERSFFTILPNIVLTLGLSPYALTLYIHLKKVTGEKGVCFKKTSTLVSELNMSAGSISAAKKELAKPRSLLRGKSLIMITEEKNRNGGKPRHHIMIADIWPENLAAFTKPVATSPDEIASSYNENTISSGEIKKNTSEEKPIKKKHTHLRAAGAMQERVCVDVFPLKTFDRYARNQPDIRNPPGWAITARRTGEWNEQVVRWCAEQGIDPYTNEFVGTAQDISGDKSASIAQASNTSSINPAECSDCSGTRFYYPKGFKDGVAKCRHTSLLQRLTQAA